MSFASPELSPIDYLAIGHVSLDVAAGGYQLGGGVSYSGLTAHALGCRVAIVTSASDTADLGPLDALLVHRRPSDDSTVFENEYALDVRRQRLLARAAPLAMADIPEPWRQARLIHLAPVADELPLPDPAMPLVSAGLLCCTPQGWLRGWGTDGLIHPLDWRRLIPPLSQMDAVALGWEDVDGQSEAVEALAAVVPVLVVTAGASGADLFVEGEHTHLAAPDANAIDPTGAGDILAAALFVGLLQQVDPVEATRRAVHLASLSVARAGMAAIPTPDEVRSLQAELP